MRQNPKVTCVHFCLIVCLIFQAVPPGYAQPPAATTLPGTTAAAFRIPSDLGVIQERSFSREENGVTIAYIQDAHGQLDAQKNIYQIIKHLHQNYGFDLILLEGTSREIHPELLDFFEDPKDNERLADLLLQEGMIGGAEKFLFDQYLKKNDQIQGMGVEDDPLYYQNLHQFKTVARRREEVTAAFEHEYLLLFKEASRLTNPEFWPVFKAWYEFNRDSQNSIDFLGTLYALAKEYLQIDFTDWKTQFDWPQLTRLFHLREDEKKLDPTKSQAEYLALTAWVQSLPANNAVSTLRQLAPDQNGIAGQRQWCEKLFDDLKSERFQFQDYPHLAGTWGHQILSGEMDAPTLLHEMAALFETVMGRVSRTDAEKKLVAQYNKLRLTQQLLFLELLPEDYQKLTAGGKEEAFSVLPPALKALSAQAMDFYENARARDKILLRNTLDKIKEYSPHRKAILISGGFHTEGITQGLREENIAFAAIMPAIHTLNAREDYFNHMLAKGEYKAKYSMILSPRALTAGEGLHTVYAGSPEDTLHAAGLLNRAIASIVSTLRQPLQKIIAMLNRSRAARAGRYRYDAGGFFSFAQTPVIIQNQWVGMNDQGPFAVERSEARNFEFRRLLIEKLDERAMMANDIFPAYVSHWAYGSYLKAVAAFNGKDPDNPQTSVTLKDAIQFRIHHRNVTDPNHADFNLSDPFIDLNHNGTYQPQEKTTIEFAPDYYHWLAFTQLAGGDDYLASEESVRAPHALRDETEDLINDLAPDLAEYIVLHPPSPELTPSDVDLTKLADFAETTVTTDHPEMVQVSFSQYWLDIDYDTTQGFVGAGISYDNFQTPEVETRDFSGLESFRFYGYADTSAIKVEFIAADGSFASGHLTQVIDEPQAWKIDTATLQGERQSVDLDNIRIIYFIVEAPDQTGSAHFRIRPDPSGHLLVNQQDLSALPHETPDYVTLVSGDKINTVRISSETDESLGRNVITADTYYVAASNMQQGDGFVVSHAGGYVDYSDRDFITLAALTSNPDGVIELGIKAKNVRGEDVEIKRFVSGFKPGEIGIFRVPLKALAAETVPENERIDRAQFSGFFVGNVDSQTDQLFFLPQYPGPKNLHALGNVDYQVHLVSNLLVIQSKDNAKPFIQTRRLETLTNTDNTFNGDTVRSIQLFALDERRIALKIIYQDFSSDNLIISLDDAGRPVITETADIRTTSGNTYTFVYEETDVPTSDENAKAFRVSIFNRSGTKTAEYVLRHDIRKGALHDHFYLQKDTFIYIQPGAAGTSLDFGIYSYAETYQRYASFALPEGETPDDWSITNIETVSPSSFFVNFDNGKRIHLGWNSYAAGNFPFQLDTSRDQHISPIDVLLVINYLTANNPAALRDLFQTLLYDTNGDSYVSAIDILLIINFLNNAAGRAPAEQIDGLKLSEWQPGQIPHTFIQENGDIDLNIAAQYWYRFPTEFNLPVNIGVDEDTGDVTVRSTNAQFDGKGIGNFQWDSLGLENGNRFLAVQLVDRLADDFNVVTYRYQLYHFNAETSELSLLTSAFKTLSPQEDFFGAYSPEDAATVDRFITDPLSVNAAELNDLLDRGILNHAETLRHVLEYIYSQDRPDRIQWSKFDGLIEVLGASFLTEIPSAPHKQVLTALIQRLWPVMPLKTQQTLLRYIPGGNREAVNISADLMIDFMEHVNEADMSQLATFSFDMGYQIAELSENLLLDDGKREKLIRTWARGLETHADYFSQPVRYSTLIRVLQAIRNNDDKTLAAGDYRGIIQSISNIILFSPSASGMHLLSLAEHGFEAIRDDENLRSAFRGQLDAVLALENPDFSERGAVLNFLNDDYIDLTTAEQKTKIRDLLLNTDLGSDPLQTSLFFSRVRKLDGLPDEIQERLIADMAAIIKRDFNTARELVGDSYHNQYADVVFQQMILLLKYSENPRRYDNTVFELLELYNPKNAAETEDHYRLERLPKIMELWGQYRMAVFDISGLGYNGPVGMQSVYTNDYYDIMSKLSDYIDTQTSLLILSSQFFGKAIDQAVQINVTQAAAAYTTPYDFANVLLHEAAGHTVHHYSKKTDNAVHMLVNSLYGENYTGSALQALSEVFESGGYYLKHSGEYAAEIARYTFRETAFTLDVQIRNFKEGKPNFLSEMLMLLDLSRPEPEGVGFSVLNQDGELEETAVQARWLIGNRFNGTGTYEIFYKGESYQFHYRNFLVERMDVPEINHAPEAAFLPTPDFWQKYADEGSVGLSFSMDDGGDADTYSFRYSTFTAEADDNFTQPAYDETSGLWHITYTPDNEIDLGEGDYQLIARLDITETSNALYNHTSTIDVFVGTPPQKDYEVGNGLETYAASVDTIVGVAAIADEILGPDVPEDVLNAIAEDRLEARQDIVTDRASLRQKLRGALDGIPGLQAFLRTEHEEPFYLILPIRATADFSAYLVLLEMLANDDDQFHLLIQANDDGEIQTAQKALKKILASPLGRLLKNHLSYEFIAPDDKSLVRAAQKAIPKQFPGRVGFMHSNADLLQELGYRGAVRILSDPSIQEPVAAAAGAALLQKIGDDLPVYNILDWLREQNISVAQLAGMLQAAFENARTILASA